MTCTQLDVAKTVTCRNCGEDFGGGVTALLQGMDHTGQLTRSRPADPPESEHQE